MTAVCIFHISPLSGGDILVSAYRQGPRGARINVMLPGVIVTGIGMKEF